MSEKVLGRQEKLWNSKEYIDKKYVSYTAFKDYLSIMPQTLLDIGCGFAHESGWFNTEHGTEIWLLDKQRNDQDNDKRHNNFGPVDDFEAYNSFESIRSSLESRKVREYKLLEPTDTTWDIAPKFDVIMSESSMGFHYPVRTYKELIEKHSHSNTKIFCSLRDIKNKQTYIRGVVYMHNDGRSGFVELHRQGIAVL
jgi:hypothetical protein